MLQQNMIAALNEQVTMESTASHKYLAMACWAETQSLEGCASFMFRQSDEERMHMMKIINYLHDSGAEVKISELGTPETNFGNVIELFEEALKNEQAVSASIDRLVELAIKNRDYKTNQFLQWYVEEQHEEETSFMKLIDRMKLIGLDGQGLYMIDEMLAKFEPEEENA